MRTCERCGLPLEDGRHHQARACLRLECQRAWDCARLAKKGTVKPVFIWGEKRHVQRSR